MSELPLLASALPRLAVELRSALAADGFSELAAQVADLRIHAACGCGDSFCTSFYTSPPPDGAWGPGHENVVPDLATGMVILDVVNGSIGYVEVIDRDDLRPAFQQLSRQLERNK